MSALVLLWLGTATAGSPDGWRVQAAVPATSAAVRPALVLGDPVAPIVQATGDLRLMLGPVAVDAELPWVTTWDRDGRWAYSYPGNLRLGVSAWTLAEHLQLGVEGSVPTSWNKEHGYSWASLAKESLPSFEAGPALHTLWRAGAWSFSGRLFAGMRGGDGARWFPSGRGGEGLGHAIFVFDLATVIAVQVKEPVSLVFELERLQDPYFPFTARPMLRVDRPIQRGTLGLDLGLQITQETMFGNEPPQLIGQVRWYPSSD